MNGQNDIDVQSFNPTFVEDGLGISGGQDEFPPYQEFDDTWKTRLMTDGGEADDEPSGQGCTPPGSPDTSKVYIRATHFVSGHWQCFWDETTTCP